MEQTNLSIRMGVGTCDDELPHIYSKVPELARDTGGVHFVVFFFFSGGNAELWAGRSCSEIWAKIPAHEIRWRIRYAPHFPSCAAPSCFFPFLQPALFCRGSTNPKPISPVDWEKTWNLKWALFVAVFFFFGASCVTYCFVSFDYFRK